MSYTSEQPESKFKKIVKKDLKALTTCWHVKVQQVAIVGTPDILACIAGVFVALELKKDEKSKLEPIQLYTLAQIKKAGGKAYAVHPANWSKVLNELRLLVN